MMVLRIMKAALLAEEKSVFGKANLGGNTVNNRPKDCSTVFFYFSAEGGGKKGGHMLSMKERYVFRWRGKQKRMNFCTPAVWDENGINTTNNYEITRRK